MRGYTDTRGTVRARADGRKVAVRMGMHVGTGELITRMRLCLLDAQGTTTGQRGIDPTVCKKAEILIAEKTEALGSY